MDFPEEIDKKYMKKNGFKLVKYGGYWHPAVPETHPRTGRGIDLVLFRPVYRYDSRRKVYRMVEL